MTAPIKHVRQAGFSLVQTAVIVTMIAMSAMLMLPGGEQGQPMKRAEDTIARIAAIKDALEGFKTAFGRLPCPTDGNMRPGDVDFGAENPTQGDCGTGSPTADIYSSGIDVVVGGLPTRALQLSDDYAFDGTGRKFTYAVDKRATEPYSCFALRDSGGITIKDAAAGNTVSVAMAAIVSHGRDGHGSFTLNSTAGSDRLNAGSTDVDQAENASVQAADVNATNLNEVFVKKELTNTFDDIVDYETTCCMGAICIAENVPYQGPELVVAHAASPFMTTYSRSGDIFTKLTDPTVLPPNTGAGSAFSISNGYLAVAHASSPYTTMYKRSGYTLTKLADLVTLPAGTGAGAAFSASDTYMAVAHTTSPYVSIYKRSGDAFTKLPNPAILPAGNGTGVAFTAGETYLATSHATSPYVTIYKRSADTFTKLANPAALPAGNGTGVSFSTSENYLATSHTTSPYVTIYKRAGDVFTKLADPGSLPTGNAAGVAFSHNDDYLAVAHTTSPYVTIYKRNIDVFNKLANPVLLPTGNATGVAFSFDDTYLAVAHATSPYVTVYKRATDTFTKVADPATLPTGNASGVSFRY